MTAESKVYSISELTRKIRATLEKSVGFVWVQGEVSNLTYHPSGHVYLTLKDAQSQISAVMFRSEAARLRFRLKDGMQVQGCGRVTVYERRGNYQIILETVQPAGMGNLQAAFEALKRKLEAEGLFDPKRKRPPPVFPRVVGVVTSPSGAALRDFWRVLHRRFPSVQVILAPSRVQGEGAAQEIAAAIDLLNLAEASGMNLHIDVIAIIRGGGSLEDLWAFNEEIVARAVARSKIPIISGVGHEVDFTICDFVADLRAPTPSAAAEMLIRPRAEFLSQVIHLARALQRASRLATVELRHRLTEAHDALRAREPRQFIREWRQRMDDASMILRGEAIRGIARLRQQWLSAAQRFTASSPMLIVARKKAGLVEMQNRLEQRQVEFLDGLRHRLVLGTQRLELLSPKATLARGYSITLDAATRRVVRSARSVQDGQSLLTHLADGEVRSRVERKHDPLEHETQPAPQNP
ncbi:MAG: exodeoxyribonuclease VII large subunit [Verrucomicrobia bacterium]|nr:exodeoxyribonuclease VII large subunit [Verrucomicrobiota bacterium]